eukprot:gene7396-11718_t
MKNAFKKHLESEFNPEPFEFVLQVKEFEATEIKEKKLQLFFEIYDNYIIKNAPKEINLSADNRENFRNQNRAQLENRNEWISEPDQEFYDTLKRIVHAQLLHDVFPRFIRTDLCIKTIRRHESDPTVVQRRESYSGKEDFKFDYDDEFFTHPHFKDKDFDFFLTIFQDSYHWKLFGSKAEENMNAYFGTANFLPYVKLLKTMTTVKLECILPCTFDQALISFFDNEQIYKSDPNCGKYETEEYYTYEHLLDIFKKNGQESDISKYKRDLSVNSMTIKLPFPFNSRVANYSLSGYYDEKNQIFMRIGKSFLPDTSQFGKKGVEDIPPTRGAKPKKTKVYSIFILSAALYKKIDDRVFFQEITIMDFAGWANSDLMYRTIAKDRKDKFRGQMLELARAYPDDAKILDYKDVLLKPVDGKTNGLGKILINTIEMNSESSKKKDETKLEEKKEKKDKMKDETKDLMQEEIILVM